MTTNKSMLTDEDWRKMAGGAYMAYGGVTNWKNYQGLPMPTWDELPPKIQEAWVASVQNTYALVKQKDEPVSHGYVLGGHTHYSAEEAQKEFDEYQTKNMIIDDKGHVAIKAFDEYLAQEQTARIKSGLTEGRIVHYVMPNNEHRPAIVVKVWPDNGPCEGYINLQVFTDGMNDVYQTTDVRLTEMIRAGLMWVTSICFDDVEKLPNTWHWIEKA